MGLFTFSTIVHTKPQELLFFSHLLNGLLFSSFCLCFLFGQLEIYRLINFKEKMARSRELLSHICVVCAGVCLQCVLLNHRKPLIMG